MAPQPINENTLFYGDNLDILRQHIPDNSIDLVYLDPPFNSSRSYNVLFRDESGKESEAQITAFEDTWHWNQAAEGTYNDLVTNALPHVGKMIEALRDSIGTNQMMAYLVMMALVWKRTSARSDSHKWNHIHDIILFYSKSDQYTWNPQYTSYNQEYVDNFYRYVEPETGRRFASDNLTADGTREGSSGDTWHGINVRAKGLHWKYTIEGLEELDREGRIIWPNKKDGVPRYKRYLDEMPGVAIQSIISDIPPLSAQSAEKLGYPTQKPLALLERIIAASSNPGDIVLDPFCGCGTAIAAAQKLDRRWIGIDITHLSIALMKYRLEAMFPGIKFKVIGEPTDLAGARNLANKDKERYQFQWWALSLIRAKPLGGQEGSREGKKGSDKGIDGVIAFIDDATGKAKRVLVQVKSGHVKSGDIRDLRGTVQREQAAIGVFITLEEPSREMITEAVSAGYYRPDWWGQDYPRIQILTIDDLLHGRAQVKMPPQFGTFKQAQKVKPPNEVEQRELGFG